jgi:hypothetical protein
VHRGICQVVFDLPRVMQTLSRHRASA